MLSSEEIFAEDLTVGEVADYYGVTTKKTPIEIDGEAFTWAQREGDDIVSFGVDPNTTLTTGRYGIWTDYVDTEFIYMRSRYNFLREEVMPNM